VIADYPLFFTMTGALRGHEPEQIAAHAHAQFAPLMQRNILFWLPAQFIQFTLVPVELHVPFVCVAGLAWNAILSAHALSDAPSPSIRVAYGPTDVHVSGHRATSCSAGYARETLASQGRRRPIAF